MLILAVDSSASPASVCLFEDGKVLAEYYINTKLTHSQTLAVMIESALNVTRVAPADIDCFAVNSGPGSFTGVRIGVSAVKGMAYAVDKPCTAVSTLECMAYGFLASNAVICSCMDARRRQVYNAVFRVSEGRVERLCEDRAIGIDELLSDLNRYNEPVILAGDGAELVYDSSKELKNIVLAPAAMRFQRASATAVIAYEKLSRGESLSAASLMPSYLRLSQAERELKSRKDEKV